MQIVRGTGLCSEICRKIEAGEKIAPALMAAWQERGASDSHA